MVLSSAARRFNWPSTTLAQVGVDASSKSASYTWAPELRALIVILASVGPVISTRRPASRPSGSRPSNPRCSSARESSAAGVSTVS